MKVALLGNDTTYIYNLRHEIIECLLNQGYEVDVFGELLLFKEELESLGCNLIEISTGRHGKNPFKDLWLLKSYISELRKSNPDIVISYNIKPNVYGGLACRKLHIPYLPNITGLGTPVENPGAIQKLAIILYKLGIAGAESVFFQNEENLSFFVNHGMLSKNTKAKLLPGSGVNLSTHPVLEYPEEGVVNFLFVARILKEKGIELYLAAARKYHSDKVKFHICGICDDISYQKILMTEQEKGIIEYHGEQKNMVPFFRMCSCVLHPSYYPEGMSNVLLEGAASGRPLICANRAGCREIVDNGLTGFVVPIKNEEAFLEAVGLFLDMPWEERKKMGLRGREKIENEFDRQIVVNEYLNTINSILK